MFLKRKKKKKMHIYVTPPTLTMEWLLMVGPLASKQEKNKVWFGGIIKMVGKWPQQTKRETKMLWRLRGGPITAAALTGKTSDKIKKFKKHQ